MIGILLLLLVVAVVYGVFMVRHRWYTQTIFGVVALGGAILSVIGVYLVENDSHPQHGQGATFLVGGLVILSVAGIAFAVMKNLKGRTPRP